MPAHLMNHIEKPDGNPAIPGSALKRSRNCDWASYDVDLLDNMSRHKRFASDSIANELASKMNMSPSYDPMSCSSADCSPAVPRTLPGPDSLAGTPTLSISGCVTPQRSAMTSHTASLASVPRGRLQSAMQRKLVAPMSLSPAKKLLTSPNDPATDVTGRDLRKVCLDVAL